MTVLFCDLVASTAHAASLELEDWRELVRGYQRVVAEAIEGFEGHVAQYMGDGVLAYFGYPKAHEDAAERAVRTGLSIVRSVEKLRCEPQMEPFRPVAVRIGIHTGTLVVGEMGRGSHSETLALGESANIAARLQQFAKSGMVVISGETLALVPGIFVTEAMGEPSLKGVSHPVAVHRVIETGGVRGRLALSTKLTPFVGREQEKDLLWHRWERVLEGDGQTVLVTGEAGIGKSRLILDLRERMAGASHLWLECTASPYMRASAFHPLVELLEQALEFRPEHNATDKLKALEDGLRRARIENENSLPLLVDLLNLPVADEDKLALMTPQMRRGGTIDALTAWALAQSRSQPVVLLVEDLHWTDSSTLEFLRQLIDQIPSSQVLMLLTARPDLEVPWSNPKNFATVTLHRLRRRQAKELVESLEPSGQQRAHAVEQIIERADGIPLYLEELTRAIWQSPDGSRAIPATLQDLLMARIDRLGPAKELAQLAAVIGREFDYRLLAGVAPLAPEMLNERLVRLVSSDLLVQRGAPPDASYVFRHALIREAAYSSLLRGPRREYHDRVAQTLEELFPEQVASRPGVLAYHYEEARNTAAAIRYYELAGKRSTARSANQEAVEHLRRGLALLPDLPAGPERDRSELTLLVSLGPAVVGISGAGDLETQRIYARARELCGDGEELPHVLAGLFTFHLNRGEMERAFELAEEQLEVAGRMDDPGALMRAHWSLGQALCIRGDASRAAIGLERAVQLFDPGRDRMQSHDRADLGVALRSWRAWALWLAGYPDRARASSEEAVDLARRCGHPYSLGLGAVLYFMSRDRERGRETAEETIAVSQETDVPIYRAVGQLVRIWSAVDDPLEQDAYEGIIELYRGALGSVTGMGNQFGRPVAAAGLAEILRDSHLRSEAIEVVESGLEFSAQTGIEFFYADLMRIHGEFLLREDEPTSRERGEQLLIQAMEKAEKQGARSFQLRAATRLARLWCDRGESDRACEILEPLYRAFTEGFDTFDLKAAKGLLDECSG